MRQVPVELKAVPGLFNWANGYSKLLHYNTNPLLFIHFISFQSKPFIAFCAFKRLHLISLFEFIVIFHSKRLGLSSSPFPIDLALISHALSPPARGRARLALSLARLRSSDYFLKSLFRNLSYRSEPENFTLPRIFVQLCNPAQFAWEKLHEDFSNRAIVRNF